MGIISFFNKIFKGSSTDNVDSADLISITRKNSDAHSLEESLKEAVPTKRGLYPHEILLLDYAPKYNNEMLVSEYPGFWRYEYSIQDPNKILGSLLERGFIELEDLKSAISRLTLPIIKSELKNIGQKVSGKKAELVDRLLDNYPNDVLNAKYSKRFYKITELGKMELKENEYIPYLHRYKYMSIWEMNRRLYKDNSMKLGYKDLLWGYFNEEAMKQISSCNMGRYIVFKQNMLRMVMEEENYKVAFNLLCEIIVYDLAFSDSTDLSVIEVEDIYPYEESMVRISDDLIEDLLELKSILDLTDEELKNNMQKHLKLRKIVKSVFTNEESLEIIMAEVYGNTDFLNKIYKKASKRI